MAKHQTRSILTDSLARFLGRKKYRNMGFNVYLRNFVRNWVKFSSTAQVLENAYVKYCSVLTQLKLNRPRLGFWSHKIT